MKDQGIMPQNLERTTAQYVRTLDEAIAIVRNEGALYIATMEGGSFFAYRKAPSSPEHYGQKVVVSQDAGFLVNEPWVLLGRNGFPYNIERLRDEKGAPIER